MHTCTHVCVAPVTQCTPVANLSAADVQSDLSATLYISGRAPLLSPLLKEFQMVIFLT